MPRQPFIDRDRELEALNDRYLTERAQMVVLFGRRRVGKTELIRRFCEGKPHIHYQAAQVSDQDNLRHFAKVAADALGEPWLAAASFDDWEALFEHLAERAGSERLIVALDEFPFVCEANRAVPSLLQRFWDHRGRTSSLFLILCGSSVSFMVNEVLAERSPLFGRRTGQIELRPLGYRDAAEFVPGYSLEDKVRVYGILGGMPRYLGEFDEGVPLDENVRARVLDPRSFLCEEPDYLLRTELRELRTYNSVLEAIASGLTRRNEITQRVQQRSGTTTIGQYLATLEELRLIRRVVPVTDRAGKRPARGRYRLRDNFLRFWYRFVLPNRSLLEVGEVGRVWEERIAPELDQYTGAVFEDICREYVLRHAREKLPVLPGGEVGVYWHRDAEIDVVSENEDGSHYCGECKWSRQPLGTDVLWDLRRKTDLLPPAWREGLRYLIFSRSGFTPALEGLEDGERVILIDLADLYGVPASGDRGTRS